MTIETRVDTSRKSFPLSRVYGLLEPGPVVLVTTARRTKANVMAMSWHTMMEFDPPIVGCVISSQSYTFNILRTTKECVINIPTLDLAKKVVGCGNTSGRKIDKFEVFGLTQVSAECVKAPLISECYANLECRVVDDKMVADYNLFILEVLKAWIDRARKDPHTIHHRGRGFFMVAGETIKLPSKMK
jgi:flavin reductase (DIM6/NTAB) family NADH-FMN oxidoreductase RutF